MFFMAEREGFEPSVVLLLHTLSKRAPSTTRPPLQLIFPIIYHIKFVVNINSLKSKCDQFVINLTLIKPLNNILGWW